MAKLTTLLFAVAGAAQVFAAASDSDAETVVDLGTDVQFTPASSWQTTSSVGFQCETQYGPRSLDYFTTASNASIQFSFEGEWPFCGFGRDQS